MRVRVVKRGSHEGPLTQNQGDVETRLVIVVTVVEMRMGMTALHTMGAFILRLHDCFGPWGGHASKLFSHSYVSAVNNTLMSPSGGHAKTQSSYKCLLTSLSGVTNSYFAAYL